MNKNWNYRMLRRLCAYYKERAYAAETELSEAYEEIRKLRDALSTREEKTGTMIKSAEFMNREELISHIHAMHGFNIRDGEFLSHIFDMHENDTEPSIPHSHVDDDFGISIDWGQRERMMIARNADNSIGRR